MRDSMIKTRILILSDTHGMNFEPENAPQQQFDVAIHCGDLSNGSKLEEFRITVAMMNRIKAPLKLVIAGNHDFTMDQAAFDRKVAEADPPLESKLVVEAYGETGDAICLFEHKEFGEGMVFLREGTHKFTLKNGASLTVYASPYTPAMGAWGFQYHPERGHDFSIQEGTDIVITHGPPRGIMDFTHGRERAGCPHLFTAVARGKPRIHCFGHIHEGWGARLVQWKEFSGDNPTHFTAIDNDRSWVIEKLTGLSASKYETTEDIRERERKVARYDKDRCCMTSHCSEDHLPLIPGEQTLFINAAMEGNDGTLKQKPWVVDIELPKAQTEGKVEGEVEGEERARKRVRRD